MKWKETYKKNRWLRIITNKYFIIIVLFAVWMLFFDSNSFLIHNELNQEIDGLEKNKEFYEAEIQKDRTFMEKLDDKEEMERFAREAYYMKKENEDIYIIEHADSVDIKEKK
ncbi:MAG: septum formation initiator family protein [Bacteroidetes bacterium]|jgi:cell division protein FtsB|nr:septum formation initiator family protein [Bacteroidota bacterium]